MVFNIHIFIRSREISDDAQASLQSITNIVNMFLSGKVPAILGPIYASAPIIALLKQDGGIRLIAIGEIWRRLVSKVACFSFRAAMMDYLEPHQVGVGVSNGGARGVSFD